jgi:hypothetical protein
MYNINFQIYLLKHDLEESCDTNNVPHYQPIVSLGTAEPVSQMALPEVHTKGRSPSARPTTVAI